MTCTVLWSLQYGCGFERCDRGADILRLMPNDHQDVAAERLTSGNHMLDKGSPARAMEHFGDFRLQSRAFACRQNDANEVLRSHKLIIVSFHP